MTDSTETAINRIFEKLDELGKAQAQIDQKLEVHIVSEQAWQEATKEKLDGHVAEHQAASTIWRKGAVGAVFMLLGSIIAWAAAIIWNTSRTTGG